MFKNSTQFATNKPVVFRVIFDKGQAVIIDQKGFSAIPDKTKQAEPSGPADRNQPIRPETNRTSSAAGSRRRALRLAEQNWPHSGPYSNSEANKLSQTP